MDIKIIFNEINNIIENSSLPIKEQNEIKEKINKVIFTSYTGSEYLYSLCENEYVTLKIKNITTINGNINIHLTDESQKEYLFSLEDLGTQIFIDVKNAKEHMKNELMIKNMFDRFNYIQKVN